MMTRTATAADEKAITRLIALSSRILAAGDYTTEQIEQALRGAWGLDSQLIKDQTYLLVEHQGEVIACGGWGFRKTLFGSDDRVDRDAERLKPTVDSAKIRAFFIHPDFARQGIGTKILLWCEEQAQSMGFCSLELMATLPGKRLYEARGFVAGKPIQYDIGMGLSIEFVPMKKVFPSS